MNDSSRLSLDIADLPLTPFGMRSPLARRDADHTKTKFNKLSRNWAMSPGINRAGLKIPTTVPESDKENANPHLHNHCQAKGPLQSKPPAPKTSGVLRKPTFSMKTNSKMPALIEEDSEDVFIMPAVPTNGRCRKIPLTLTKAPSNNVEGSTSARTPSRGLTTTAREPASANLLRTFPKHHITTRSSPKVSTQKGDSDGNSRGPIFDLIEMSSIGPVRSNEVMCSTRLDERRESVMTDIDEGPFVEYTSLHPEGKVIYHNDSVDALKNNLYFTCETEPNETQYSTSSKQVNARYGFHKLVDAIKKQKLLSQVSKDVCHSTDISSESAKALPACEAVQVKEVVAVAGVVSPQMAKVFSSTMIDNKVKSQCPVSTPNVSSIAIGDTTSIDDSMPLASQYLRTINSLPTRLPVQQVVLSHNLVPAPQSNNDDGADNSVISEDVSLAASFESNLKTVYPQQHLFAQKTGDQSPAADLPSSKPRIPINDYVPSSSKQPKNLASNNNLALQSPAKVVSVNETDDSSNDESIEEVYNARPRFIEFSQMTQEFSKLMPVNTPSRAANTNAAPLPPSTSASVRHNKESSRTVSVKKKIPPAAPVPITPSAIKPSVCRWIVNSPFKDGSFDSSFFRHGGSSKGSLTDAVKTTVAETSSYEDDEDDERMPVVVADRNHTVEKDAATGKKMAERDQKKYCVKNTKTILTESSDSPHDPLHGDSDNSNHTESLRLRLEASSRTIKTTLTIGRVAKSPPAPALRSVTPATLDIANSAPSAQGGNDDVSKKEPRAMPKVSSTGGASKSVDTPARDGAVTNRRNLGSYRRKPIADLADSDSDDSLPNPTPTASVTKKKGKTTQKSSRVVNRVSRLLDEDKENDTSSKACNSDHMYNMSIKDRENQCASPELKTDVKTCSGQFTNTKIKAKANPPRTTHRKTHQPNSSGSDEVSNYMQKWKEARQNKVAFDESDSCDADSGSSFVVESSDEDDLSFYLPSLNKRPIRGEKESSRRDLGSISEELPNKINPNLPTTFSTGKVRIIQDLDDSSDSVNTPVHVTTSRPKTQIVTLSDSDDGTYTPPNLVKELVTPLPKPRRTKGLITPLPVKTPKPAPRKTLVHPQTVEPSKSRVTSKVYYTTETMNCATPTLSFLTSLSAQPGSDRPHPDAVPYLKNFQKNRENLVNRLYKLFNSQCFDDKLPADMSITWNVRLTKTAGYCCYLLDRSKPSGRGARVELSTKVVDSCERVRDTLIHELCHAAAWIISGYRDGHGALFKSWGWKVSNRFPELPAIGRCHNYKISCKYTYRCTKCQYSIGRHSKSLDISSKVCGRCRGPFELLVNGKSARQGVDGVPGTPRTPAPFALFVKENYGSVMKSAAALKHADVMKILGEQFKGMKT